MWEWNEWKARVECMSLFGDTRFISYTTTPSRF